MHQRHRLDHVSSLPTLPGFVRKNANSRTKQKHMNARCKSRPAMSIANPQGSPSCLEPSGCFKWKHNSGWTSGCIAGRELEHTHTHTHKLTPTITLTHIKPCQAMPSVLAHTTHCHTNSSASTPHCFPPSNRQASPAGNTHRQYIYNDDSMHLFTIIYTLNTANGQQQCTCCDSLHTSTATT